MLTRVLGVRLDPLEVGLGADALDLELGHEDGQVAGAVAVRAGRSVERNSKPVR